MLIPQRALASAHTRAALIAAAVLLVATGCASPNAAVSPTATNAVPADSSSSASPGAVLSVFSPGGTAVHAPCETLLDTATVAQSFPGSTFNYVGTGDPLLAIVGGVQCDYYFESGEQESDEESVGDRVYVAVAPSIIATPSAVTASLIAESCGSDPVDPGRYNPGCRTTATVNGWWYSLSVYGSSTADAQRAGLEAIHKQLEASLAMSVAPTNVDGAKQFDCASVKTAGKAPRHARIVPDQWQGAEIFAAAFLLVGPITCEFTIRKSQRWDFTVYPGGAIALGQCRYTLNLYDSDSPQTPVSIDEVQEAYEIYGKDTAEVCASDGTNLIHVVAKDYEYALEEEDLKAIGELLVPIFAAAGEG